MTFDNESIYWLKKVIAWFRSEAMQDYRRGQGNYHRGERFSFATATSTITGLSGSTLGSGTATLVSVGGGTLDTSITTSITAYNLSSSSISNGSTIGVEFTDGIWVVTYVAC